MAAKRGVHVVCKSRRKDSVILEMKVENYRKIESKYKRDEALESIHFDLTNGTEWHLKLYPMGRSSSFTAEGATVYNEEGFVSLYLCLNEDLHQRMAEGEDGRRVKYSFYVVKADGTTLRLKGALERPFVLSGCWPNWGCGKLLKREDLVKEEKSYVQSDGSLMIQCHMDFKEESDDEPSVNVPRLYSTRRLDDFVLKTATGKEFKIRRNVLSEACPVFERKLEMSGDSKSGDRMEISISEKNDKAVEAMVQYMYTSKIKKNYCKGLLLFDLFSMADKYELLYLKIFCLSELVKKVDTDNVVSIVNLLNERGEGDQQFQFRVLNSSAGKFLCDNWASLNDKGTLTDIMTNFPIFTAAAVAKYGVN